MSRQHQLEAISNPRMFLCHQRGGLFVIVNLNRMIQAARCHSNQTQQHRVEMTHGRCQPRMICPTE